jgi:hypothetical protein
MKEEKEGEYEGEGEKRVTEGEEVRGGRMTEWRG